MTLSIETDKKTGKVLAAYLKVAVGEVARTVEIEPGNCYVDEDKNGNLLGVEMLAPVQFELPVRRIARKYKVKGMMQAIRNAHEVLAA